MPVVLLTILRRLWAPPALLLLAGCVVPPHHGYDTPLDTALTFQAAFARDQEVQEFHCLTAELKQTTTLQGYGTLRQRFFAPLGTIGRFVLRRNSLRDNVSGTATGAERATLWFDLLGREFGLFLEAEPLLVMVLGGGDVERSALRWSEVQRRGDDGARFGLELPRARARALAEQGLGAVELRLQWKIAALSAEPRPADLDGSPGDVAEPIRNTLVDRLQWSLGEEVLGHQLLLLDLPLEEDQIRNLATRGRLLRPHRWQTAAHRDGLPSQEGEVTR